MDLTNYMLIDLSTGTMLLSKRCVLVHEDALTEAEWDALDGAPDSDIVAIGRERGIPLSRDAAALDAVAALLSAEDWSSDHLLAVADMIRATGRTIEDIQ
jgi:hypothetical protein